MSDQRRALTKEAGAHAHAPRALRAQKPHQRETAADAQLLGLQTQAGNRVAAELMSVGQAKLEVGAADDRHEVEADAVAAEVVSRLQSRSVGGDPVVDPDDGVTARRISRLAEVGATGGEVSGETEEAIARARGGGSPLAASTRSSMESAFGADFSQVRVHTGPAAADLNDRVQAKAFTIGSDIFFRGGAPDAGTGEGQSLLAHELAHTVQQGGSRIVESEATER